MTINSGHNNVSCDNIVKMEKHHVYRAKHERGFLGFLLDVVSKADVVSGRFPVYSDYEVPFYFFKHTQNLYLANKTQKRGLTAFAGHNLSFHIKNLSEIRFFQCPTFCLGNVVIM